TAVGRQVEERYVYHWALLDRGQRANVLRLHADWRGFDHEDAAVVVRNILDGRPREEWFSGLAAPIVPGEEPVAMPDFRADTFDALLDGKRSYLRDDQPVRESDEQRNERQMEVIWSGAYFPEGWEAPHLTAPPVSSDAGAVDRARTQVEALKAADFF